jgi:enterochelin esterase-like enzyme
MNQPKVLLRVDNSAGDVSRGYRNVPKKIYEQERHHNLNWLLCTTVGYFFRGAEHVLVLYSGTEWNKEKKAGIQINVEST